MTKQWGNEMVEDENPMIIHIRERFYGLPFIDQIKNLNDMNSFLTELAIACEMRARELYNPVN